MHQLIKPGNFAAIRLNHRIDEAKTANPEAKPTEIQDMMMGEIRKHYRALLEKRGASMPLSGAIVEDVTLPAPSLASSKVDIETGEIFEIGEGAISSLPTVTDTTATIGDLEPELGFMAELSEMLTSNKSTPPEDSNE